MGRIPQIAEIWFTVRYRYRRMLDNAHKVTGVTAKSITLDNKYPTQISEIVAIEGTDTFVRPIYAGNAMQKVKSGDAKKIITVRTTAFKAAEEGGSDAESNMEKK